VFEPFTGYNRFGILPFNMFHHNIMSEKLESSSKNTPSFSLKEGSTQLFRGPRHRPLAPGLLWSALRASSIWIELGYMTHINGTLI
jgi:hypothetical protein